METDEYVYPIMRVIPPKRPDLRLEIKLRRLAKEYPEHRAPKRKAKKQSS